jgi:diguanylate cyclase (GGDEF)-like protein/PAS domain S-box-containing protein
MRVILKIPLVLAVFFVLYFAAMIAVERSYIRPRFESLERTASSKDLDRVLAAIDKEAEHLAIAGHDWSQWDDTWHFAKGQNPGFVAENLDSETFRILDVSFIVIYGNDGLKRYGERHDSGTGAVLPDEILPAQAPVAAPYLIPTPDRRAGNDPFELDEDVGSSTGLAAKGIDGFIVSEGIVYLVSSTPIMRSDGSGPLQGSFIFGKAIDGAFQAALTEQTSVQTILRRPEEALEGATPDSIAAAGGRLFLESPDGRIIRAWSVIRDLYGRPALLVGSESPREITAWMARTMAISGLVIIALGIMICGLIIVLLSRLVTQPLSAIGTNIGRFEAEGRMAMPAEVLDRPDEIGRLSQSLQQMASRIQAHDSELLAEKASLETRIEERTRDLRKANDDLKLMATVVESTSEAIVITDLTGTILVVNDSYRRQSGYTPLELIGSNPGIMKSDRHDDAFFRGMWDKLGTDGTWSGEIWNRRKNGEVFPAWLAINLVRSDEGTPKYYVGVSTDITQLKETEERLNRLAYYDPLTSLPNRTLFRERLDRAIKHGERYGQRVALLFLDLDRFKYVNDALGHDAGDRLLVEVAQRITRRIRISDTVCRLGGDEFTVILDEMGRSVDAGSVARDIIADLSKPFILKESEVFIGASVGISVYPDDDTTVEGLTRKADAAMYQAKMAGRDTFSFVSRETETTSQARLALESDLRRGLERGEFFLVYQPIVDIKDGRILGAEALVRWRHGEGDPIPPCRFITLAEETGIILELGDWVMRQACADAAGWGVPGVEPFVSVNISPRQFDHAGLAGKVRAALDASGLPPRSLVVELTESALMHNVDAALRTMGDLKGLGARLAIDDFGTGYSSLSYLGRFPVDKLKIDQSFTMGIGDTASSASIVNAVIAMARSLGIGTIAEGVETEEQRAYLALRGCHEGQGYLFSRPVELGAFRALLEAGRFSNGYEAVSQAEAAAEAGPIM